MSQWSAFQQCWGGGQQQWGGAAGGGGQQWGTTATAGGQGQQWSAGGGDGGGNQWGGGGGGKDAAKGGKDAGKQEVSAQQGWGQQQASAQQGWGWGRQQRGKDAGKGGKDAGQQAPAQQGWGQQGPAQQGCGLQQAPAQQGWGQQRGKDAGKGGKDAGQQAPAQQGWGQQAAAQQGWRQQQGGQYAGKEGKDAGQHGAAQQGWGQQQGGKDAGKGGKDGGKDAGKDAGKQQQGGEGGGWQQGGGGRGGGWQAGGVAGAGGAAGGGWQQGGGGGGGGGGGWQQGNQGGWGNEQKNQEAEVKKAEELAKKKREELEKQQKEQARQAEWKKQQEEQKKAKEAEQKKQQEEQRAVMAIKQVTGKLLKVQPEGLDALKAEVEEILTKELDACGGRKETVKTESDKAIETAGKRCEQMVELKKKKEEERIEAEKKQKEAHAKAEVLLTEFEELIKASETTFESLKEAAQPFSKDGELPTTADGINSALKSATEAGDEAKANNKACSDFYAKNSQDMKAYRPAPPAKKEEGDEAAEEAPQKPTLAALQKRMTDSVRNAEVTSRTSQVAYAQGMKKITAKDVMDKREAAFKKHDKDKDGALNLKELIAFVKADCNFTLSKEAGEKIFRTLVAKGEKGVVVADVFRVRSAVGIEVEKVSDAARKKKRLAREEELAKLKAKVEKEVAGVAEKVTDAGETVAESEKTTAEKHEASSKAAVFQKQVTDAEELVKATKEKIESAREAIKGLDPEKVDPDLKKFLEMEVKKLEAAATNSETRSGKVEAGLKKLRADAKKKAAQELDKLRADGLTILRHHRSAKKLTTEDMFGEVAKKADKINEKAFVAFFKKCEKPEGEKAAAVEDSELPRLFTHLDEESEGFLSKEAFTRMVRSYMKVVKDTVLTSCLNTKAEDAKDICKLKRGDVVEVLQMPEKDEGSDAMRVHAKAVSDDSEGWVTLTGEKNTLALQDCTGNFRVVKETILTDSFDLAEKKEVSRSLHQTTKKLQVGDIVEVREWPKKDETSGLTRMKCRAKSDGRIGFATTLGNAGAVFLQIV